MKVSAELIEKIKDMLSVYVCPELQQAAKDFLAGAEATGEADPANLIAELKDDICSIDDFINFTQSDYCLNMNGEYGYEFEDRISEGLRQIFAKYGCYFELGNAWNLTLYLN